MLGFRKKDKDKEIDVTSLNELIRVGRNVLKILFILGIVSLVFLATYILRDWGITSGILTGNQIQPLITWGKVNENYEMSVAITVSHIFVNGSELGLFYKKVQENFNQPI